MKNSLYSIVGKRIQEIRKGNNVSQQEMAEFLNLSRTSISNIENGRHPIFLHHLYTIAQKFSVPLEKILPSVFELNNAKELQENDWVNILKDKGIQSQSTIDNLLNIIKSKKS